MKNIIIKNQHVDTSESIIVVLILAATIIGFYLLIFFPQAEFGNGVMGIFSNNTADWGQFGDYVGGILNPIVAFAAFYLLSISIRIQQKELKETKIAIEESSIAQQEQVKLMWRTTQLTALSSLMDIRTTDIELAREKIKHLQDQIAIHNIGFIYDLSGKEYIPDDAKEEILKINEIISSHVAQKNVLEEKINEIASDNEIAGES